VTFAEGYETLPLGNFRVAQRLLLALQPAGAPPTQQPMRVWLVNVHMHHGGATPAEQARCLMSSCLIQRLYTYLLELLAYASAAC
jgi:hypothetical protein